jgi:deoxyhypusine synthase
MWTWMHKNMHRIDEYHISEEEFREICKQPDGITQRVVNAVAQYNKMVSLSGHLEEKDGDELLIKEAEEEEAKVFLDGIFDIVQPRDS